MNLVISAIIILFAVNFKSTPSFAFAAANTVQFTQTPNPVLYKCPNANLPDELVFPKTLEAPSKGPGKNNDLGSSVFRVQQIILICKNQITLFVNLTSSQTKEDLCNYAVTPDGTFIIMDYQSVEYKPGHYCISTLTQEGLDLYLCGDHGTQLQNMRLNCSESVLTIKAVDKGQSSGAAQQYKGYVLLVGPLICAAIDIAILLVYLVLWDKQSCYGWSIMAMVISLLSFYAGVATFPSLTFTFHAMQITQLTFLWFCVSAIFTMQFAFLCTYCWTLVLAYHVWNALRTLSPRRSSSPGLRRFLFYCAFAYGVPILVVAVSLAVFSSGDPNYPENCFNYIDFVRNWFIYFPTGLVFLCNLVLMYLTVKQLREAKKNRGDLRVHGKSEGSSPYTDAVIICKLLVLMGVFLAFDLIIHFVDASGIGESIYSTCFEYIYRIFHSVCLFWIFVCNNEVRDQLAMKFPGLTPYIL